MSIQIIEKRVLSCDGEHKLYGKIYLPEVAPKGYVQVVHGMTEHIARYHHFMTAMAEKGYICFGHDHLGHGHTVNGYEELGYIAKTNGYDMLTKDVGVFASAVKAEYGNLPYYLLGHSMGSFIVRCAVINYINPDKLIVMGSGGPNPATPFGLGLISIIKTLRGERYISKLIYKLVFGSYNRRFEQDGQHNWLTKDKDIQRAYAADKLCTFSFTLSAMHDLLKLNEIANSKEWFNCMKDRCPVLLVSGADDPVGNYGKGIKHIYNKLKKNGTDVSIKLYDNCRHEILNDTCKNEVINDILLFIS